MNSLYSRERVWISVRFEAVSSRSSKPVKRLRVPHRPHPQHQQGLHLRMDCTTACRPRSILPWRNKWHRAQCLLFRQPLWELHWVQPYWLPYHRRPRLQSARQTIIIVSLRFHPYQQIFRQIRRAGECRRHYRFPATPSQVREYMIGAAIWIQVG